MEDVQIHKADLKVDTFRSSGAGGQHVNKTESGVRFTHLPTGVVAESTDGRSQIRNREIALQRLYQKIYEARQKEHASRMEGMLDEIIHALQVAEKAEKMKSYENNF